MLSRLLSLVSSPSPRPVQQAPRPLSHPRPTPRPAAPPPPLAPGRLIYAVGDIHGRYDLLERLLERIGQDIEASGSSEKPLLVFLGDYVDRGEESARVVARLDELWRDPPPDVDIRFLMGNHEEAMLDFLDAPETSAEWLRFGGLQTLFSYGVRGVTISSDAPTRVAAAKRLKEALGPREEFLRKGLELSIRVGNVVLCHAALDPDLPPDRQSRRTLLWGDSRFLERGGPQGVWVAHGHTITREAHAVGARIAVDTGAYYSGRLTAARIADGSLGFLTA